MPGIFSIHVKQCTPKNLVLAALGNSIVQANYNPGDASQLWLVDLNQWEDGDNAVAGYSIINQSNGMAAFWNGGGQPIILKPNVFNDKNFTWRLDSVGQGYYAVNRWDGGEVFDVKGDSCDAGATVIAFGWNGGDNQRWKFEQEK